MDKPRVRPILFNGPMVRALLEGRKTQTRREVKDQTQFKMQDGALLVWTGFMGWQLWSDVQFGGMASCKSAYCPFGKPGDLLYVRETSFYCNATDEWIYRADGESLNQRVGPTVGEKLRWTPSIHSPRVASRITLRITDVGLERLEDISEMDAIAEGIDPPQMEPCGDISHEPVQEYFELWESIYGPGETSPWVWVVKFAVIKANVEAVLAKERGGPIPKR